ncbi:hypothetical protein A4A58_03615 [Tardiphaga robiniae]|uniref:Uncharacterized protein n=2 Tax=Tardiphaga robiniae TaxID=943830 RepID=A0A120MG60_9BRAD|nr:hypothetical protein PROKKA_00735 [Tardiphaga robiniae]KZD25512.1 hypothetical protein A4A58_03615 [Tardiphaga robiniae]
MGKTPPTDYEGHEPDGEPYTWPAPEDEGAQPDYEPDHSDPNAEQELLDHYLAYDKEPSADEFDPMAMPAWSWFMVLAWIAWRNPSDVRKCCDEYRANCWRYSIKASFVPRNDTTSPLRRRFPPSGQVDRHVFQADAPMNGRILTVMETATAARLVVTVKSADALLKNALVEGRLTAIGAESGLGCPVEIEAFKWTHIEVNEKGELYYRKTAGQFAYNEVRFMRADLMKLWPANSRPATVTVEPDRGGRPQEFKWDEMKEVAREMVRLKGLPGKGNTYFPSKSQFAEAIKVEFARRFDQHPEDSTVRGRSTKWLKEFAEN